VGGEGGALKINEYGAALPYFFPMLNHSETQVPVLADIYKKMGIRSVAIVYLEDLHGTEFQTTAVKEFEKRGIVIKTARSIPIGTKDISYHLKRAKALDVDAFVAFVYPNEGVLAVKQAMELDINFKVFHVNVGACFGWFPSMFGPAAEGIMGGGAWNCKSSKTAESFCQKYLERFEPPMTDWWGHIFYYASLQIIEQAIEQAGTLNQEKIRDIIATHKFETVLGETWFENGRLATACHPGEIGQWQNGVFEVLGPEEKATAEPIIKPVWPTHIPK
jgi:branched-chain amino acid transport system substrate-binding protein